MRNRLISPQVSRALLLHNQPDASPVASNAANHPRDQGSILNLKPPDFTTLLTIMNGEGYWFEVAGRHGSIAHLQDTAFAPLLHFMNSLEPHNVKDDPYNELNMLLKADVGQKNGGHACATDEDLAMEFLVHDFE